MRRAHGCFTFALLKNVTDSEKSVELLSTQYEDNLLLQSGSISLKLSCKLKNPTRGMLLPSENVNIESTLNKKKFLRIFSDCKLCQYL